MAVTPQSLGELIAVPICNEYWSCSLEKLNRYK